MILLDIACHMQPCTLSGSAASASFAVGSSAEDSPEFEAQGCACSMLGLAWQPAANIFALTAALAISACMLASSPTATSWFEEGPAQLSDSATEEVIDDGERERSTDSIVHSGWSRLAASRGMRACLKSRVERMRIERIEACPTTTSKMLGRGCALGRYVGWM